MSFLLVHVLIQFHRVVVASVLLVNAHTWGLNSSYAVFLAYYLRSGTIIGSSPLSFAFVGGLSISIGMPPLYHHVRRSSLTTVSAAMLVSPAVTWCVGRFGTAFTLRVGAVFEACVVPADPSVDTSY